MRLLLDVAKKYILLNSQQKQFYNLVFAPFPLWLIMLFRKRNLARWSVSGVRKDIRFQWYRLKLFIPNSLKLKGKTNNHFWLLKSNHTLTTKRLCDYFMFLSIWQGFILRLQWPKFCYVFRNALCQINAIRVWQGNALWQEAKQTRRLKSWSHRASAFCVSAFESVQNPFEFLNLVWTIQLKQMY